MKELKVINNENMLTALNMVMFGVAVNVVIAYYEAVQDKGATGLLALLEGTFPMVDEFFKAEEDKDVNAMIIESTKEDIKKLESKPQIYKTSRDLKEIKELKELLKEIA